MQYTLSILVENQAGVLSKISGLFSRRGFNIDSLAVGVTQDPSVSRITIVANGDEYIVEQLEKQLNKLIDTLKVKNLSEGEFISRELQMIKINANAAQRSEILTICEIIGAKVVDLTSNTVTVEICDTTPTLKRFAELVRPYGIKELVRTGVIAIEKGSESLKTK